LTSAIRGHKSIIPKLVPKYTAVVKFTGRLKEIPRRAYVVVIGLQNE
jgi:hypothetical protein